MTKYALILTLAALVLVSGCVNTATTTTSGTGMEITGFSPSADTTVSDRTTSISMVVENQGESIVENGRWFALLIAPSDWDISKADAVQEYKKDLKPADPATGAPAGTYTFRWSPKAPILPKGQTRTDKLIGRLYYQYETITSGPVYVYPYGEQTVEKSTFTTSKGPIIITATVAPDPPVIENDGESFGVTLVFENVGDGVAFLPDSIFPTNYDIAADEFNFISVDAILPSGMTFEDSSCLNNIELVNKKATAYCDVKVNKKPSAKTAYTMKFTASYGYYTEKTAEVTVSGKTTSTSLPPGENTGTPN